MSKLRQFLYILIIGLGLQMTTQATQLPPEQRWTCNLQVRMVGSAYQFLLHGYDSWTGVGTMTCIGVKRPIPKTVYVNVTYRSWTTTDGVDSRNTFWFSSDRFYVDDPDQAFGQYHAEVTNVISADFLRRLSVAKADHSFEMDVSESSLSEELIPSLRWGSLTISLTRDI